jgi:hypothetical protein
VKVLIATPTVQGTVTAAYARTLISLTQVATGIGATYTLMTVDNADVVTARNVLAHGFLSDEALTHILFLDSDMAVEPAVIRRLIELRAPIAGVAYPERRLDLAGLARALEDSGDINRAKALASSFTLRLAPGRKEVRDQIMEVDGFGFGCVLIVKPLLRRLIVEGHAPILVSTKLRRAGLEGDIHDFFSEMRLDTGERLSEDHSFCERVRQLGDVPVLAYIGPGVRHFGQFAYDAVFMDLLGAAIVTRRDGPG